MADHRPELRRIVRNVEFTYRLLMHFHQRIDILHMGGDPRRRVQMHLVDIRRCLHPHRRIDQRQLGLPQKKVVCGELWRADDRHRFGHEVRIGNHPLKRLHAAHRQSADSEDVIELQLAR